MNTPFYEVSYQAHPALLRGRSTRPLSPDELPEACELLLMAAQHYQCTYWLLDARFSTSERPWALEVWLTDDFLPRVSDALDHATLHIAFLVDASFDQPNQPPVLASPATSLIALPYEVGWFREEARALGWLNQFRLR